MLVANHGLRSSAGCVCLFRRLASAVLCVQLGPGCAGCPAQLLSFILHAVALTRLDLHALPISVPVQVGPGGGGCPAQCAGRMDRGQPGGCAAAAGAQNEEELQPAAGVAARPAHACGVCAVCMVRLPTLSSVQALQSNPSPCALPPAAPAEPATPAAGAPHGGGHALPSPAAQHPAQRAAARGCGHVPAVSGCAFTHKASWEAC